MNIAILSRNPELYSTRRLKEAAMQRGHNVRVLNHLKCYVSIEKGNPGLHYEGERLADIDAIVPRIGASVTFYGTAIVRQFEMMRVFTTTKSQSLVKSRDKLNYLRLKAEGFIFG
jgi:ribosomal protein S6--L-glutamate ligase